MECKPIIKIDKNGKVKLEKLLLVPIEPDWNTGIACSSEIEFESTEINSCLMTCDSKKFIDLYFAGSFWKRLKFAFKLVFGFYKFKMPKEWLTQNN